ncbi:unnamed protein product [Sphagnum jensenii]|uniref:Nonsense-mediated mRNA decay factor SMG8 n=1 Tax=Sphagnum jensenii TaxID=128206 RepID=A0ABP1BW64_9BRYO
MMCCQSRLTRPWAGPSKEQSTASAGQDASAGFYGKAFDMSKQIEQKATKGLTFISVSEGSSDGHTLLGLNLPIYMNCPYCRDSDSKQDGVTPPFPLVLASRAVVEFQAKAGMEFQSGSEVVLPLDSFLGLQLPFVYYMEGQNGV